MINTNKEMWKTIEEYNNQVRLLVDSIEENQSIPDDIKERTKIIDKQKEDFINSLLPKIEPQPESKKRYKKQEFYTYFDPYNLYCEEEKEYLQENLNAKNFLGSYSDGHLYVFDKDFVDLLFDNEDDSYDFFESMLWDIMPYEYYYQNSYAGNQAISRFIEECQKGQHNEAGSLERILFEYVKELNPNDEYFEIETQTRDLLWTELGEDLFEKLYRG